MQERVFCYVYVSRVHWIGIHRKVQFAAGMRYDLNIETVRANNTDILYSILRRSEYVRLIAVTIEQLNTTVHVLNNYIILIAAPASTSQKLILHNYFHVART
jgi:hypothetical protein